jgi:actin-like ATPase involved in cell morphogenesis
MTWRLAIDFGTSSTAAAIWSPDRSGHSGTGGSSGNGGDASSAELLSFGGVPHLPSVVLASESGSLVVGFAAEQQVGVAPERAERTPKRRLGDAVMLLGSRAVRPVEAVAAVFSATADEAIRRMGGTPPSELRLTHPARWGSLRLRALAEAAEIAGLPVPSFVPEPVAAAVYFADEDRVPVGSYVAVYDLGGGTFDTAVLQRTDGGFIVIGVPGGDERLGGEAFDDRLFDYVGERLAERLPEAWEALRFSDERAWRKAGHDLRVEARRAKEALSSTAEYTIYLGAPIDAEIVVTRDELESLIHRDVQVTVDELEATVTRAGLTMGDLAAVNVVGGSSRIPLVTRLVAERFGAMPSTWGDPKAAVVLGATRATSLASVPPASTSGTSASGSTTKLTRARPLPATVGGYEVLAELGRGGMGVVYLARQESLGRLVAVKTLPSLDGALTARLEREAAVLSELQHPHIATVLDIGTDDRGTYVVMPFFAGGTLSHVLDSTGSISAGAAAGVLASVAEALAATHSRGFLHRDVKPSNVLLSTDGDVYLADYGLAFPLLDASRMTSSRAVLGTAAYTAPEVIADEPPTPAADVYALGITGYQLLAGRTPFSGTNVLAVLDAIRRAEAEPLDDLAPGVPKEMVELIAAAMAPNAADRPSDLRAWAAALRASTPADTVSPAPPATWATAIAAANVATARAEDDEELLDATEDTDTDVPSAAVAAAAAAAAVAAGAVAVDAESTAEEPGSATDGHDQADASDDTDQATGSAEVADEDGPFDDDVVIEPDTAAETITAAEPAEVAPPTEPVAAVASTPPLAALVGTAATIDALHEPGRDGAIQDDTIQDGAIQHDAEQDDEREASLVSDGRGGGGPLRRLPVPALVAAAVAVIALIAGVAWFAGRDGGPDTEVLAAQETADPSIEFPEEPLEIGHARRVWTGADGELRAEVTVTNTTDAPVDFRYVEVIPKSLAATADLITSEPPVSEVLVADPVLAWDLSLEAGASTTITYRVAVEGTLDTARLEQFRADHTAAVAEYQAATAAAAAAAAPALDVTAPGEGQVLGGYEVIVEGATTPGATVRVNGAADLVVGTDGRFSQLVGGLVDGPNVVSIVATSPTGVVTEAIRNVVVDTSITPPDPTVPAASGNTGNTTRGSTSGNQGGTSSGGEASAPTPPSGSPSAPAPTPSPTPTAPPATAPLSVSISGPSTVCDNGTEYPYTVSISGGTAASIDWSGGSRDDNKTTMYATFLNQGFNRTATVTASVTTTDGRSTTAAKSVNVIHYEPSPIQGPPPAGC